MGWLISHDLTKKEQVAEIVKGWSNDDKGVRFLAHSVRGNVLYAVGQSFDRTTPERFEDRFILVCLLRKDRGYGWGYKDMSESMGPYKYDCPLKFLKMAPVANEEWRANVLAHHARVKAKKAIGVGTKFRFAHGYKTGYGESLDEEAGTIIRKQGRGYVAEIGGSNIKVFRRHIGEIIYPVSERREAINAQKARA
jgi:hypothetical protein